MNLFFLDFKSQQYNLQLFSKYDLKLYIYLKFTNVSLNLKKNCYPYIYHFEFECMNAVQIIYKYIKSATTMYFILIHFS